MGKRISTEARFWAKVSKDGPVSEVMGSACWIWKAATDKGYGQFWDTRRMVLAHRWAYQFANGEIPDGIDVDHRCRVRACVNPAHLRLVTNKQNGENRSGARRDSKSGILGVSWNAKTNRWTGAVQHNGKQISKTFVAQSDAERWVVTKRNELFTHNDADRHVPESPEVRHV